MAAKVPGGIVGERAKKGVPEISAGSGGSYKRVKGGKKKVDGKAVATAGGMVIGTF